MVKQIFEISDDAAKQINVAAEESESSKWPLRISLNVDSSGSSTISWVLINLKRKIFN